MPGQTLQLRRKSGRPAAAPLRDPRILYSLTGDLGSLSGAFLAERVPQVARMGFDHLVVAAPPDPSALSQSRAAIDLAVEACRRHGLGLVLQLAPAEGEAAAGPAADDAPPDPRRLPSRTPKAALDEAAAARLPAPLVAACQAGVDGFICRVASPDEARRWAEVIARARAETDRIWFAAWTDREPDQILLRDCGFDAHVSAAGLLEAWQRSPLCPASPVLPAITYPEPPSGPRLAARIRRTPLLRRAYLRSLRLAAAAGDGLLLPMGFEFAAREPAAGTAEAELRWARETSAFDLSEEIAATIAALTRPDGKAARLRSLSGPGATVVALLRTEAGAAPERAELILANTDLQRPAAVRPVDMLRGIGGEFGPFSPKLGDAPAWLDGSSPITLDAGETRVLEAPRATPVAAAPSRTAELDLARAIRAPRVAIEAVSPSPGHPRFPVKRIAGESLRVEADVVTDGHEITAVALLWRPEDERGWRERRMAPIGNDRWAGEFPLERMGRYLFAVEAWRDDFATFLSDLRKKQLAGLDLTVEIEEGRLLVERARDACRGRIRAELETLLAGFAEAAPADRLKRLQAPETAALMTRADRRPFAVRQDPPQAVDAERRAAGFASWYELFPRSASGDPHRHGTFDDVIRRLPVIRAMGFDVLYFPPIHPIGRKNRKGRNNTLTPGPDDPGSPYAIGAAEGGHDAIHPQLGTIEDFRRLRDAAAEHGLELALDFAIQCAPDHPWLREHPGWFGWRPDGSIRYAENPPKKYEDIVNVEFYAEAALPELWRTLRDIVAFWVGEGVRLFRVDNPHTKPFPFWEWLIADIRSRDPGVVFLAEAFTRPKVMYRLAKIGFSQSYTYFTWRNTKAELTGYLTELTTTAPKDYFRPHFFVNTPDINPQFLQTSGRPGFLIRAALATTLSGLWGMYNGFELCEAQAVPGKEEYLDSEKYQLRAWDWDRPGNIIAEITRLNRIRHANPALQTHLGLTFYNAFNDSILYYGKATPDRGNVLLVAVNLDPHRPQEADIEIPLWEWGLPDHGALAAENLMTGEAFTWHGKIQHIRLDPAVQPFAIWRIRPAQEV
ncbi:alpha-1,4-glucan--maltose-1-phosphate maltosyltransferase [Inquilinus limosus]|uniref:alpha-1,4-glucan--maltose-1-phosphate maltosyltransferase n=1 Tax=Inquilinus limosus TaxID=171674 RepID=UPI0009DBD722|nr:maltotransferase domain-containing protein [Inquilinus limosus]